MTATTVDLTARRRRAELAVTLVAAAPVRYVPPAFLRALECLDAVDLPAWTRPSPPPLRALAAVR